MIMNTALDAIKKFSDEFIYTARSRASTTPCMENKINHTELHVAIKLALITGKWSDVEEIISRENYKKAFKRLVWCLPIEFDDKNEVVRLTDAEGVY